MKKYVEVALVRDAFWAKMLVVVALVIVALVELKFTILPIKDQKFVLVEFVKVAKSPNN